MFGNGYISLEKVAREVNLPQRYIRKETEAGKIPHLVVGGRLRYQLKAVRAALERIEQEAANRNGNGLAEIEQPAKPTPIDKNQSPEPLCFGPLLVGKVAR